MNKYRVFFFFVIFISINTFSQNTANDTDLRTLVTLLDYISKDYPVAVENGEIINEFEFAEMSEFAKKSIALQQDLLPTINNTRFEKLDEPLRELQQAVADKKNPEAISTIALNIKNKILDLGILKITPNRYPSLKNGATLYQNNCVSCHGGKGYGNGALAGNLNPAPTNFHEAQLSPLQAYNVIKLGIEGTGMASYNRLTEEELWDLSFYVLSLKHNEEISRAPLPSNLHLDSISKWNDEELQHFLNKSFSNITVGQVRNYEPERPEPLNVAMTNLDLSYQEFQKGNNKIAEKYALTSYLEGVELVENILGASAPSLVRGIERDMIAYRKALQNNNKIGAENYYNALKEKITSAKTVLAEKDYSLAFIYGAALSILIREALEALLIILIILRVLRPMKIKRAVIAVHSGWIFAVLTGVVSWFFVDKLINLSGASRELMEGVGAILAVLVLLFAGIWLHSHSEISKWKHFIKNKINRISETGNMIGLLIFSFIVVFREAFEVVLFLSSLKLSNPDVANSAINWALLTSVIIIAIITIVFLKFTKELPVGKFFKLASYMVAALAIVLTGKGIMAFQEAGYIPISPIDLAPRIELLGIYPNLQSILAQLLVLGIIVFFQWRNLNQKADKSSQELVTEE
ncbi:FTR1 family protein [Salegentibacter sp. BDJ18]|uniref:cytochrome c/FTR1 family iron permease n=1 Tax=Salegentibacter sp. BDJ18 TaxID=2816376 RepID=UPI001AAF791A|nr:FTR1 family protein [Salegentibacter sp. BDJ18]MBO2544059.1 FTR1 family protein [Salegentibacter sp. BDJ18]